jgi:hypothetical protein
MIALHLLLAILFLLGAVVQLNDPDPIRWIAIYLAAAGVALGGRRWRVVSVVVAGAALLWAATIALGGMEPLDLAALVGDATMKTAGVEAWRELLGLLIIAAYCLLAARSAPRAADGAGARPDPGPPPR